MDVTTVSNNYAQAAGVRSSLEGSVAFKEQNTQNQRPEAIKTQPRQAESAQSQYSQETRKKDDVQRNSFVLEQDQDGPALASSEGGQSEEVSFGNVDTPRGSYVDILA